MIGEVRARSDLKPSSSLSLHTASLGWRENVQGLPGTGIRQSCNPVSGWRGAFPSVSSSHPPTALPER